MSSKILSSFLIDSLTLTKLILSALLLIVFYYASKLFRNVSHHKYPPGPKGFPLIGYLPNYLSKKPYELMDTFAKKYGSVFTIFIGGRRHIVLNNYETIKAAYITDGNNFSNRPEGFCVLGSLLDFKAMALKNGDEWISQKKLLSYSWKSLNCEIGTNKRTILESRIFDITKLLLNEIRDFDSKPVDLFITFANSTINVVSSLVCGESLAINEPETVQLILNDICSISQLMPGGDVFLAGTFSKLVSNRFTQQQKSIKILRERQFKLMNRFIQEHESTFDPDNIRDYIDIFLKEKLKFEKDDKNPQWFDLENLSANMFMFYIAGTGTTSAALYFALFLMANYPQVQKKCQEELDKTIGRSGEVYFSDRKRLRYIEAVINEIFRYSIIGPLPQPRSNLNATFIGGYHIPANSHIITNLWSANRDPTYWPNPYEFDPNNFYERDVPRDLASLAFSAGKRICPGESLARLGFFLFFTSILQEFTISIPSGGSIEENILPGVARVLAPFKIIATTR